MNYRPNPAEWALWDTWLFPDPDGRRMHLFYLANHPNDHWEWVGHALSDDLVHWQELPHIQVRCPGDPYDVGIIGTGMVFPAPGGGFMMSYTANLGTARSRIGFLHSRDLLTWEKRWQDPRIEAQAPYYETDPLLSVNGNPAFRDAYVHRVGDAYEALVCAESAGESSLLHGCIARYRATDSSLHEWEALPPLVGPGLGAMLEVPEHFELGGRHYVLWSNLSEVGPVCDTPSRRRAGGTFYASGERYEGPYSCPADNLLIGAGDAAPIQSYVGRTVSWRGERLLYHHLGWPLSAFAFPKRLLPQADGTLCLGYWPGIERVHARTWPVPLQRLTEVTRSLRTGVWRSDGLGCLHGAVPAGGSLVLLDEAPPADLHLRCRVTAESATRWGVTLRDHPAEKARIRGVAVQADLRHGEWQFGAPVHHWCSRIDPIEGVRMAPRAGQTYRLDLLVRDIYVEIYIDGVWRFTRVIAEHARQGRLGFYVESGAVRFEGLQAWDLEPLAHPYPSPP